MSRFRPVDFLWKTQKRLLGSCGFPVDFLWTPCGFSRFRLKISRDFFPNTFNFNPFWAASSRTQMASQLTRNSLRTWGLRAASKGRNQGSKAMG